MKHSKYLKPVHAHILHERTHVVSDFPKPGILFRNVLPLLSDPNDFRTIVEALGAPYLAWRRPDLVVGVESRGFIFGAALARYLDVGFVAARKSGKLPGDLDDVEYKLEYDEARLEMQRGAVAQGDDVVVVDDLLATGGTAAAAAQLVQRQKGNVLGFAFVVELESLGGRQRLNEVHDPRCDVHALLTY